MGKSKPAKKRETSLHSRAARRASSPSLNTDKSLKTITPPSSKPQVHHLLPNSGGLPHSGGIRKNKRKGLTRQQRLDREKRLERADIVNARLEVRAERSVGKLKAVRERKGEWDRVNKVMKRKGIVKDVDENDDKETWEDENDEAMDVGDGEEEMKKAAKGEPLLLPVLPSRPPAEIPLPADEDEVL